MKNQQNNMVDVKRLGGSIHWYGPSIASIVLDNEHGKHREFYNFYGGEHAIEDIHNHRGDLYSTILKGGMRNHLYSIHVKADAPYCMYRGYCISACSASRDFCCNFEMVESNVELKELIYFDSFEGDKYFMEWQQFHWVELLTDKVISHVEFGPVLNDVPTLVRNISTDQPCLQGPGSAIDDGVPENRPSDDELWAIIEGVVA